MAVHMVLFLHGGNSGILFSAADGGGGWTIVGFQCVCWWFWERCSKSHPSPKKKNCTTKNHITTITVGYCVSVYAPQT